ncbi:transposase-like protein [Salinibacter ruber]|mgnify:FL=1|jgi:putative transposase|uniref:Mutator family transposase n=1 Tax=Salinibacter ruber TaxID=146919 RepID=A0AAW5PCA0_9BACT|nr:IS256 family transposase [Salinibacter ruber]MCS3658605.1 transposase-like protein [Salinibacter ruber]MCS4044889.1 transposase-like protein [Salinibacter ruber]MCS4159598.1 transposase-like protein [Salinibacter ruber]MCS4201924.1 transposase-like protein [Salinibacter ruber]MCS4223879.1 transposase-like protein [Salinibacter ruber]
MATFEITIDDEKIQELLHGDRGMAVLLEPILNQILQAEMTDYLGAAPGERTDDRQGYRNGSYQRQLTTRVGTLELEVPRDREGEFQTALFQRYQRSEKALVLALMQMVVQGVSTRRVKKITTELCGREFSSSTVSRLTEDLDEQVEAWAERSLEQEYPFLVLDAMHLKVRRQGGVRSTTVMLAVGIGEDGQREILGLETAFSETEEAWRRFIRGLKERGLSGVELATSDAHPGLIQALKEAFPGLIWQRCQAHFRRNVLDRTPSGYRDRMHQILDQLLEAPSQKEAQSRFEEIADELEKRAEAALEVLEEGLIDATAVLALPGKYRRRLRTTNMVERFIEEIRRREKVVRIFPNRESAYRLVGALCAETHEEWSTGRRYLDMNEYFDWKSTQQEEESKAEERAEPVAVVA